MRLSVILNVVALMGVSALIGSGPARAQVSDQDRNQSRSSNSQFSQDQQSQDQDRSQRNQSSRYDDDRSFSTQQRGQSSTQQSGQSFQQRQEQDRSRSQAGEQGGLGVTLEEDRQGPRITRVMQGTPAQEAGLREMDLILEIDGRPVRSADDVVESIRGMQSGERVELTVLRQGRERTLDVELTSREQALSRTQRDPQRSTTRQGQQYDQYAQDRGTYQPYDQRSGYYSDQRGSQQQVQQIARQLESLQRQVAQLQRELQQMRSGQRYDARATGYETDARYPQQDQQRDFDRRDSYQTQDDFGQSRYNDRSQSRYQDEDRPYQSDQQRYSQESLYQDYDD